MTVDDSKINTVLSLMRPMTEEERLAVMSNFCGGCGIYLINEDGGRDSCQCQNDE